MSQKYVPAVTLMWVYYSADDDPDDKGGKGQKLIERTSSLSLDTELSLELEGVILEKMSEGDSPVSL